MADRQATAGTGINLDDTDPAKLTFNWDSEKTIFVKSAANLPTPSNNYHPLAANTVYVIEGDVTLTNGLDFGGVGNGSSVICLGTKSGSINYTGNQPLLKSTGGIVETRLLTAQHLSAELYDVDGDNASTIIKAPECTFVGAGGGIAGGVLVADFEKTTFVLSTNPLQIDGTNINLLINQAAFVCDAVGASACLDLRNGTYVNVRIENSQFYYNGTGYGIRSQSNSSNIGDIAILSNNDFVGTGTALENIEPTDSKWVIQNNAPINEVPDTKSGGSCYIGSGGTQTTVINNSNTPVLIQGIYTIGSQDQFAVTAAGRITYTGLRQLNDRRIVAKFNADPASGSNKTYNFYFRKNGTEILTYTFSTLTIDASNPTPAVLFGDEDITTGDYYELVVENATDTTNITCSGLNFTI